LVLPSCALELIGPQSRFVSRGGEKLAAALVAFSIDLNGKTVLDVGSSTGGFTDCALQAGASRVVCVDVGTNQLHEHIRANNNVVVREQTDARKLTREMLQSDDAWPVDVVVADLSFVSLRIAMMPVLELVAEVATTAVMLVKPQFEATRGEANKGRGIIKDPLVWQRVLNEVADAVVDAGWAATGLIRSPITGGHGNVEFLLHCVPKASNLAVWDPTAAIEQVCSPEAADRQD